MSTETLLDISVIICTYTQERWDDLLASVKSLQQQIALPGEIIVVVDHNTRLLERAQAHMPGVVVIANTEAQGLSGARNRGIAVAKGSWIAFLDDDAMAEPDWLLRLSRHCEEQQVLGAGGAVEPLWLSGRPDWFPEEFYWVVGCTYSGLPEVLSAVRNPYGGCTCFRREVFDVVGGFREGIGRVGSYPMGGEETELCIRARQHWPEKKFLYDPQSRIHHRIPAHRASWRYFRSRCYAEGLSKALVAKYVGAKDCLSSERSYTLKVLPRGVVQGLIKGLLHLNVHELTKAGAIVCGLAITTWGYLVGMITLQATGHKEREIQANHHLKQSFHPNN